MAHLDFSQPEAVATLAFEDYLASLGVDFLYGFDEGPTCNICDGLGHGYPGAGPCPLEERGEQGVPYWAQ
jgi:hypothetical protein